MMREVWDIYNADGVKTGKSALRGRCVLGQGEYHLVVHIWIISRDGRFLIQRRSDQKEPMAGEWAATGGAAISGEDSFAAAQRELREEMGIKSDHTTLKKLARIKRRNSLVDIWAITVDIPAEELSLQKSEVAEAKWVTGDRLREMIANGDYHNYGKEYYSVLFSKIEEYRGVTV